MAAHLALSESDLRRWPSEARERLDGLLCAEARVGPIAVGEVPTAKEAAPQTVEISSEQLAAAIAEALRGLLPAAGPRSVLGRAMDRLERLELRPSAWVLVAGGAALAVLLAGIAGVVAGIILGGVLAAPNRIVDILALGAATVGVARVIRAAGRGRWRQGTVAGDIVLAAAAVALGIGMRP